MGGVKEEEHEYSEEEVVGLLQSNNDDDEEAEVEEGLNAATSSTDDNHNHHDDDNDHRNDVSSTTETSKSKSPATRILLPSSAMLFMILVVVSFRSEYSRSLSNANTTGTKAALGIWSTIWDEAGLGSSGAVEGYDHDDHSDHSADHNDGRKEWEMKIKSANNNQQGQHDEIGLEKLIRLNPNDPNVDVTKLTAQDIFDIFPAPHHPDTIQIYNEKAYHELIESFVMDYPQTQSQSQLPHMHHNHKPTKTFTICANGGSSTAGGGGIEHENRYFTKLESFLRSLDAFGGRPSEAIDRSHGTRHSLHSAIFAPNFIPPDTDLLLWEFAINDYPYSPHIPEETQAVQTRQMFLAWLREIERMNGARNKPPPKVILIYLWKTPFRLNEGKVDDPVYDFHADIAKEFDFVVGHVNFASYIDHEMKELGWAGARHYFLADAHHPNKAGHLGISFLLMVLLRGQGEWHQPLFNVNGKIGKSSGSGSGGGGGGGDDSEKEDDHMVEKYEWFCGEDTKDEMVIRNLVLQEQSDHSYAGWRSPLGSMTMEQPKNLERTSGPRQLYVSGEGDVTILGKQDPVRQDRQGSISLPCCSSSDDPSTFPTVKVPIETEPMNGVKGLFLAFGRKRAFMTDMKVYMTTSSSSQQNNNNKPSLSPGRLIQGPGDWPCFWSFAGIYETWWFEFTEEEYSNVSSLSLCVDNPKCSVEGERESGTSLISMAVY